MIRARFFYGNYDGKNQTPVFDLHLGVNVWLTVEVANVFYDVIHVPSTDYIDVCLVNSGLGVPYISTLELRHLENSIYKTAGGALTNIQRYDMGSESKYGFR